VLSVEVGRAACLYRLVVTKPSSGLKGASSLVRAVLTYLGQKAMLGCKMVSCRLLDLDPPPRSERFHIRERYSSPY
jgi:hypothetical protein